MFPQVLHTALGQVVFQAGARPGHLIADHLVVLIAPIERVVWDRLLLLLVHTQQLATGAEALVHTDVPLLSGEVSF